MPIITLTTDFGTRDGYVGAVKGTILRIAPDTKLVDIAHDVPRGDVAHAAWIISTAAPEFPPQTVHLVVVDPGVGTERKGVIAYSRRAHQRFVGPDNGVFGYLEIDEVRSIENAGALAPSVSRTFHGRDIFAHVAGGLALGRPHGFFGPSHQLVGALPWGPRTPGQGRIVHIDHYGNLISDLPAKEVTGTHVSIAGHHLPIVATYADVAPGQTLAYVGSADTIEIAIRDGRADSLGLRRGTDIMPASGDDPGPYR